jgi:hypothetical protein
MSLLETARQLNAQEEARKQADERKTFEVRQKDRRVELFKEIGAKWFNELSQAISDQTQVFNSTTGDHTKLVKIDQHPQEPDKITIELIRSIDKFSSIPACSLRRSETDLHLICELKTSVGTDIMQFDVLPTEKFEIKVVVCIETERKRVVHPEDEGRRPTGDIFVDLRTVTDKIKTTNKLDTYEFADYILDSFVKRVCNPKR